MKKKSIILVVVGIVMLSMNLLYSHVIVASDEVKNSIGNYIEQLKSNDVEVRIKAAYELGRLKHKSATPALLQALEDKNNMVRAESICALGKLCDKTAVPALLKTFENEDRPTIKSFIIEALGKIGDKRAVPLFLKVLKTEDVAIKRGATFYLGKMGGDVAVLPLLETYKDGDINLQKEIILALKKLKDKRALPLLLDAVKDKNASIRLEATDALGWWGNEAALLKLLKQENDEVVRATAIRHLGRMKSERAVPALIKILKDKKESINSRYSAAAALANLNKNEILLELLKNKDIHVQYASAFALAEKKNTKAIPVLIKAMRDESNPLVQMSAIEYLRKTFIGEISPELQKEIGEIFPEVLKEIDARNKK